MHKVRLRVKTAKGLTSDETGAQFSFRGVSGNISCEDSAQPLKNGKWFIFTASGLSTEEAAWEFAVALREALETASFCMRFGLDAGEDKPTSFVSEAYARAIGLIVDDEILMPNVHGVQIVPEEKSVKIPNMNITALVSAPLDVLVTSLAECEATSYAGKPASARLVRLMNLALMTSEPLAQIVIALSAIEGVAQGERWSETQQARIRELSELARTSENLDPSEADELAKAIDGGLFRVSLRQGVLRMMASLGLSDRKREWDRVYGVRSSAFHGNKQFTEAELAQAAVDTLTLCGAIVGAILERDGVRLASVHSTHYR
ncbi:MAG: hypothetical protein ACK40W_06875 [Allorhizobium sp.]